MNPVIAGIAFGMVAIAASYGIAFSIGLAIRRADKREEQRPDYLADDPRLASLFRPPHGGGDNS